MEPGIGVPPPRESALARVCTRVHFQAPGSNSANRVQRSSTAGVDRGFVSFRGIRSLGRGGCRVVSKTPKGKNISLDRTSD